MVAFGVLAFVSHAALAECELMLRVCERRRCAGTSRIDAARPEYAIADDVMVLARAYRSPDFLSQFLTDHAPFPDAAAPYRERHDQEERQEDHELRQCVADEVLEKPGVGRGLGLPGRGVRGKHPRAEGCGHT